MKANNRILGVGSIYSSSSSRGYHNMSSGGHTRVRCSGGRRSVVRPIEQRTRPSKTTRTAVASAVAVRRLSLRTRKFQFRKFRFQSRSGRGFGQRAFRNDQKRHAKRSAVFDSRRGADRSVPPVQR